MALIAHLAVELPKGNLILANLGEGFQTPRRFGEVWILGITEPPKR